MLVFATVSLTLLLYRSEAALWRGSLPKEKLGDNVGGETAGRQTVRE